MKRKTSRLASLFFILTLISCTYNEKKEGQTLSQTSDSITVKLDSAEMGINLIDSSIFKYSDTADNSEIIAFLDSLQPVTKFVPNDFVFNIGAHTVTPDIYGQLRDADATTRGASFNYAAYRDILPLDDLQKKYYDLITNLGRDATFLSTRDNFTYPQEGANKPAQVGLGYSWGSKEFSIRKNPPGDKDTCKYLIYGLDCSGFIYQLFKRNGILILQGTAADQRRTEHLKSKLALYFGSIDFQVQDLGKIELKQIQTGDVIYFRNSKGQVCHIGMAFKDMRNEIKLFESSGSPNACLDNLSKKRGVRGTFLDERLKGQGFSVVRVNI